MKFLLALALGFAPMALHSEEFDCEVEDMEEFVEAEEPTSELKDLIGAMKSDRAVNKDRVKRIKNLLKEKGWDKKSNPREAESTEDLS